MPDNIGHYASQFVEEFRRNHEVLKTKNSKQLLLLADAVAASSHWVLTDKAFPLVWETDISKCAGLFDGYKLLFEAMAIEYSFPYGEFGLPDDAPLERDTAKKRIAMLTAANDHRGREGFYVHSLFIPDHHKEVFGPNCNWCVSPASVFICYEHLRKLDWIDNYSCDLCVNDTYSPELFPALRMFAHVFGEASKIQRENMASDVIDEIKMAIGFLAVLTCNNAPVRTIDPPAKLNKKRIKHGKAPIPAYRTLHVSDHRVGGSRGTGTHGSPRTHWRRGHIRNQPTAKGIIRKWIRPMIINAGGETPHYPETVLT